MKEGKNAQKARKFLATKNARKSKKKNKERKIRVFLRFFKPLIYVEFNFLGGGQFVLQMCNPKEIYSKQNKAPQKSGSLVFCSRL